MSDAAPTPTTTTSAKRIAANRRNARKSTGPRTEAGKNRARGNALKHGLSGGGVVQTPALEAAFRAKTTAYTEALRPRNAVEEDLVRAAALGACRFEQARRDEADAHRRQLARLQFDAESARRAALARMPDQPAAALRELTASTAGIDALIEVWNKLDATIVSGRSWGSHELDQALNLLGLHKDMLTKPVARIIYAPHGDIIHNREGTPERARAKAALRDLVTGQIARLMKLRAEVAALEAELPPEPPPTTPAEELAADRRQRHETEARRAWQSSLHRLHVLRTAKPPADPVDPAPVPKEEASPRKARPLSAKVEPSSDRVGPPSEPPTDPPPAPSQNEPNAEKSDVSQSETRVLSASGTTADRPRAARPERPRSTTPHPGPLPRGGREKDVRAAGSFS